ncbi:MAG: XisH family protein [Planktothrix sp.]|uniref:XisH family protein n=1 Tax=Planktothrix sp. TaxID=3088171 RepID=UPI0038D42927
MPARDATHKIVKQALIKDGWEITDDPYVISYGERFLFVDLAARESEPLESLKGRLISAKKDNSKIAIEIKEFRGQSSIADLQQAIGQYMLYRILLSQVDPKRVMYLAVADITYNNIFSEPVGELAIAEIPLNLLVVDVKQGEIQQWIPQRPTEISSNKSS